MSDQPLQSLVDWIRDIVRGNELQAVLIALAIFVITLIISRLCTKLLRKALQSDGSPLPSSSILINVARVCVWAIGISIILAACFNVNVNGLLTALGVGGIAVSLGLQGTIQNFFGGLQITLMKIIKPGDHIVVGSTEGIVQDVSWRQTTMRDFDGITHLIPNSVINSEEVCKINPDGMLVTPITFAYNGQDLGPQLHNMQTEVRKAVEKVAPLEKGPLIQLTSVGNATVSAKLRFVLESPKHAREARDAALRALAPVTTGPFSQKPQEKQEEKVTQESPK